MGIDLTRELLAHKKQGIGKIFQKNVIIEPIVFSILEKLDIDYWMVLGYIFYHLRPLFGFLSCNRESKPFNNSQDLCRRPSI